MSKPKVNQINLICIKPPPVPSHKKTVPSKLLSNLGKATKRGLRKCPNCGFPNGSRRMMCKNTVCMMIFKESERHKSQLDSFKLITGTSREVYSVLVRDKGPDQRGFVQLPCKTTEIGVDLEMALCFVNSCHRSFDNTILKCHENNESPNNLCVHIEAAMKTTSTAHGLTFKHNLINNLLLDEENKKKLCSLAKASEGPVVQRINKKIFAVKCAVTAANPLGYLHVLFNNNYSVEISDEQANSYYCPCSTQNGDVSTEKCIHYYACVVAFASDGRIVQKYLHLIKNDFDSTMKFSNVEATINGMEIEVMQTNLLPNILKPTIKKQCLIAPKVDNKGSKMQLIKLPIQPQIIKPTNSNFDILSFNEWLSSVTERINYSVLDGEEDTLSFHIPNRFYDLLKERLSRLRENSQPDELTTVIRELPPVGTFDCVIWRLERGEEVKTVFNTDNIKLKVGQLNVSEEFPLTFYWMGSLLKSTNFGELKVTYRTNET